MASQEHFDRLRSGVSVWNKWREEHPNVKPNLRGANLSGTNLREVYLKGADLREANLSQADLRRAYLRGADLVGTDLREADLSQADIERANLSQADLRYADLSQADLNYARLIFARFSYADLSEADLSEADLTQADLRSARLRSARLRSARLRKADLSQADFSYADLSYADLSQTDLSQITLIKTDLTKATLTNCRIYGISAWDLNLADTIQKDLIVTPKDQPTVTVDSLEVAQFIYLLLHNEKIRDVIDNITSKAVLILGCFTPERKAVLDALRSELRKRNFTPILFDFDKPTSRNLNETVSTLAHMARFVIADITDAKSIPQELQRIVPDLPSLPVQPIILASQYEYAMFKDFQDYPWMLPVHRYTDTDTLLTQLDPSVITPALTKAKEIEERRKAWEDEAKKG